MSKLILLYLILSIFVISVQCQAEVCPTPSAKNKGVWFCNEDQNPSSYCYLKCDPGYATLFTSTSCISGVWTDLEKMECEQSVFLLIGGWQGRDISISSEIFHNMENVTCTNHLPYLEQPYWNGYATFVHNGLLYLCGYHPLDANYHYWCASLNMTDQSGQWKNHFFSDGFDLTRDYETVIIQDTLYFLDKDQYTQTDYTVWTTLPLENEPKLNRIRNLPILFEYAQCIVQTTGDSFIVIGKENIYSYNKAVINYNEITANITEYPMPKEWDGIWKTECEVAEEGGKKSLILAGGFVGGFVENHTLAHQAKAEMLHLNDGSPDTQDDGTQWKSLGRLNVPRTGFRIGVKENGILLAMGGNNMENEDGMDTVEIFDWGSKKWNFFEQKLNVGRQFFSKVEIPASIFNCEKEIV